MRKELEVLHSRLFKAKARAEKTMAVLISGVPGSGKTHLARQYVFTQRDCYPGGIFWIDSKSRESAYKCFWEIAQAATLVDHKETVDPEYQETQRYVSAVRNWLQTRQDWLLVFDGVTFDRDDDINEFRSFLPWNHKCSIIYTSIDTTLRKKQRLYEPYCLMISRLHVEDACRLLFKDLGIIRPTAEQVSKATRIVEHYECLPLAIHAIGHRLNATGKPIEKYHVKSQVTDKKLAEPFLSIVNDLFRLQQRQALHLINLLSFLGHQVPVGLLNLGRAAMTAENLEIQTSAQTGEEPDLDNTLGTLIHYGLIERTSDAGVIRQTSSLQQFDHHSDEETAADAKSVRDPAEIQNESSQEGLFSIYRHNSAVDVIKIHSVVQGFCRDELRIKDEEYKGAINKHDPGFYDTWLIVATRFLLKSYEAARERMNHYQDCGLVRDYREYETHASRLVELFPRRPLMNSHPPIVREAREGLRRLLKNISKEIENLSPSSSHHFSRNQKSVFDRSSSSSSSFPESSTDEGISRQNTFNWDDLGSPRAESPEQMAVPLPRFRLELFPPHIFREPGYESEEGYETDGEAKAVVRVSPALSQLSNVTEKGRQPLKSSPPVPSNENEWQVVHRHQKQNSKPLKQRNPRKFNKGPRNFRGAKADTPLAELSSIQGRGSSSRMTSGERKNSAVLGSEAERALTAVRRYSNSQASSESSQQAATSPPTNQPASKENMPTYANVATRRILEVESAMKRPSSVPVSRALDPASGVQMKPSSESLDSQMGYAFASPLSRELRSHELLVEPMSRSTYSEPGDDIFSLQMSDIDYHTAPGSRSHSRRASMAQFEIPRNLSASVPSLHPYQAPPLPYDEDITISIPNLRRPSRTSGTSTPSGFPRPVSIAHPSAIMPGTFPQSSSSNIPVGSAPERPTLEALSRGSSAFSHQSWATEPVRYPPRFSPVPSFQHQPQEMASAAPPHIQQQQLLSGIGSWTAEMPLTGSALQSDPTFTGPPPSHRRLGSMDERLKLIDPGWNPDPEPSQYLHFGGHRVDVRDARHRLSESARLQAPRHVPQYQLYHSNLSGPLVQHDGHAYAPAPPLEAYGRRARSGSSPPRPNYDGLGVRFS
jgi:hypothetical protein